MSELMIYKEIQEPLEFHKKDRYLDRNKINKKIVSPTYQSM
jgi:hypothetical protein